MKTLKKEWFYWAIFLIPIFYIFIIKQNLPTIESFKISFREPYKIYNQFLLVYIGTVIFYIVMLLQNNNNQHKGFSFLKTLIVLFGMVSSILFLATTTGLEFDKLRVIWLISGIFITLYGNFYPVIPNKSFFRTKNRWTKSDQKILILTHRISGKVWFLFGIAILILSLILDLKNTEFVFSITIFCLVFFPHLLSYIIYANMKRK